MMQLYWDIVLTGKTEIILVTGEEGRDIFKLWKWTEVKDEHGVDATEDSNVFTNWLNTFAWLHRSSDTLMLEKAKKIILCRAGEIARAL